MRAGVHVAAETETWHVIAWRLIIACDSYTTYISMHIMSFTKWWYRAKLRVASGVARIWRKGA